MRTCTFNRIVCAWQLVNRTIRLILPLTLFVSCSRTENGNEIKKELAELRQSISRLDTEFKHQTQADALELAKAKQQLAEAQKQLEAIRFMRGMAPTAEEINKPKPDWTIQNLLEAYLTAPTLGHRFAYVQLTPEVQ